MADMVKLWCNAGEHEWHRPSQRGRRPFHCPDHAPSIAVRIAPAKDPDAPSASAINRQDFRDWSRSWSTLSKLREQAGGPAHCEDDDAYLAHYVAHYDRWAVPPAVPSDS